MTPSQIDRAVEELRYSVLLSERNNPSHPAEVRFHMMDPAMLDKALAAFARMLESGFDPVYVYLHSRWYQASDTESGRCNQELYREFCRSMEPLAVTTRHDTLIQHFLVDVCAAVHRLPLEDAHVLGEFLTYAAEWGYCGTPTIRLSDRQAAAFAFSDLAESEIREWKPPWRAFDVQLSSDLFGDEMLVRNIRCYQVSTESPKPSYFGGSFNECLSIRVDMRGSKSLWATFARLRDLHDGSDEVLRSTSEYQERVLHLCGRILLNTVVEANVPAALKPEKVVKWRKRGKRGKQKRRIVDSPNRFELSREVTIDVCRYVRSSDAARIYKCRWMVRGHRRHQACGPRHSMRKWIYVEPYMKGPNHLPMSQRAHVLKEEEDGAQE